MPIYEYRRPDGTTFEIQQSFSDETLTHDPETGVEVERVLHAPAVHFKGKGFYNTDYGTRKRQRENAANAEGSSSESSRATRRRATRVLGLVFIILGCEVLGELLLDQDGHEEERRGEGRKEVEGRKARRGEELTAAHLPATRPVVRMHSRDSPRHELRDVRAARCF